MNSKYLEKKIEFSRIFNSDIKMPTTPKECLKWFEYLVSDLSPENLSCDGEISRENVLNKRNEIKDSWAYLESIYSREVTLAEIEELDLEEWRKS